MIVTGTHFNYYQLCHRKLWLLILPAAKIIVAGIMNTVQLIPVARALATEFHI